MFRDILSGLKKVRWEIFDELSSFTDYHSSKTLKDPKQETVRCSGISWDICKSAPRSRQITSPAPHNSKFFTGRMPFLPPNQQRQSTEGIYSMWAQNRLQSLTRQRHLQAPVASRRDDVDAVWDSREHAQPHCSLPLKQATAATTFIHHY